MRWKCKECVKYQKDACVNGGKYEWDDCRYKLIDIDYAYKKGKTEGINECRNNGYEVAFANGIKQGRVDAIEEMATRLLNNEVIDKSVVRRVAVQLKGAENE